MEAGRLGLRSLGGTPLGSVKKNPGLEKFQIEFEIEKRLKFSKIFTL